VDSSDVVEVVLALVHARVVHVVVYYDVAVVDDAAAHRTECDSGRY